MVAILALAAGSQVIAAPRSIEQHEPCDTGSTSTLLGFAAPGTRSESARTSLGSWDIALVGLAAASVTLIVLTRWHRLRRTPRRPEALSALAAFALLLAMFLCGQLGAIIGAAIFGVQPADPPGSNGPPLRDVALVSLCSAIGSALVLPVFFALQHAARTPSPDMRFPAPRTVALSVAALLLIWPVVAAVGAIAAVLLGAPDEIAHSTLRELASGPLDRPRIILMLLAVFAAPVLEEVMYRGLLQEALIQAGLKRWPAIVVTSMMFAAVHVGAAETHALPALFVFSLALGWAYEKSGRLAAPMLMHALFNIGNLVLARLAVA